MNLADDGAAVGGTLLATLSALSTIAIAAAKWIRERDRRRRMSAVPPSPEYVPPASDPDILARLDRAERHDALVAALFRAQGDLVDTQRQLAILREENHRLALRVHELEVDAERRNTQLRVEREAVRTLRGQLAHVEQELSAREREKEQLAADLRRALVVRG